MNSLNHRLETVKPVLSDSDSSFEAAVVVPSADENRSALIETRYQKRRRIRKAKRAERYGIDDSAVEEPPSSWLSQLLSGWMFSLILHCLLLICLGNLITHIRSEGPLTLTVSLAEEEIGDEITVDIAPIEPTDDFEADDAGSAPLDLELAEEDPVLDEFKPIVDLTLTEPVEQKDLFESENDDSFFKPVDLGSLGLDEGDEGTAKGKESSKVKFFGLESSGDRFVFVLDISGSMGDERRYERAVYELTRSLDMLETDQRFMVVLYNDETYPMLGMTERNIRMIPATTTNRERVEKWLKGQMPQYQTKPMNAMRIGLLLKPSSIFFLSDGEFHDGTIPMLDRLNVHDSSTGTNKIPINTITLGSTGIGAPLMKYIADQSGGAFLWVQ